MSAGSKPPAAVDSMHTSTGGRCSFGTSAPLLTRAPRMHFREPVKEVRLSYRSWSNSSGRHRPGQKHYPHASLDLLQCPPCACESLLLFLRLPPGRDVATELDVVGLLSANL